MGTYSNTVLDAALNYIGSNCNKAQVVTSASAILVNSITLDSGNFGAVTSGSTDGRKIQCLQSAASDMKSIAVTGSGSAAKVRLLATSTVHVTASIASAPVALTSTDLVNLGTFDCVLRDPA